MPLRSVYLLLLSCEYKSRYQAASERDVEQQFARSRETSSECDSRVKKVRKGKEDIAKQAHGPKNVTASLILPYQPPRHKAYLQPHEKSAAFAGRHTYSHAHKHTVALSSPFSVIFSFFKSRCGAIHLLTVYIYF